MDIKCVKCNSRKLDHSKTTQHHEYYDCRECDAGLRVHKKSGIIEDTTYIAVQESEYAPPPLFPDDLPVRMK